MTRCCGVFPVICPGEEAGAGLAPACWPDQKPVRVRERVTRHSPAARGFHLQTDTGCVPQRLAGGRLRMLADRLDYVVGVDPHRDSHALGGRRSVRNGTVVFEADVAASERWLSASAACSAKSTRLGVVSLLSRDRLVRRRSRRASSPVGASGCSRLAGRGGSAARAARPTRSTLSAPPVVCSRRSIRRRRGQAVNARRCRRWWPHGKARSTPSVLVSASCAIC